MRTGGGLSLWPRRRDAGFARRLKHKIEIPPGPDGRPGESVLAPGISLHPPWPLGPDGSRSDFRFLIGRGGSHFGAVCFGRVMERGGPRDSAQKAIRRFIQRGWEASDVEDEVVAGEPDCRHRLVFPRSVLVDWNFAHRGWLFGAGVLCRPSDQESVMIERALAVLATWTWLDDDA
jgi:hypothetical protein